MSACPVNKGRFAGEQQALDAVVQRLTSSLDLREIWLFGSRATGEARPDSDFDLLVVGAPGSGIGSEDYEAVDKPVRELRVGCDIVPCGARDFDEGLALETSFISEVVRNGRVLYRAEPK